MHWITQYLSLPHAIGGRDRKGVDCYGLLYLVYREQFGEELPLYPGLWTRDIRQVYQMIIAETPARWHEISTPTDGCAVAMSPRDAICHVGIWADSDGGKVVHMYRDRVAADTLRGLRMRGIRTIKFYGLHHRDKEPLRAFQESQA
jgi:cell wall-associated NlpC family hydrolase